MFIKWTVGTNKLTGSDIQIVSDLFLFRQTGFFLT